jgi:hypothetical protein
MTKKAFRLAALLGVLLATGWPSVPEASAGGMCRIWCDNGIVVEGYSDSYEECQQSFLGNCSQWGWYGGTFCYDSYPCQTV